MLNRPLGELSFAGWCLAALSVGCTVLVAIPIGAWVLDGIETSTFREWRSALCMLLALPGLLAAVLVFLGGARLLGRLGVSVRRPAEERAPDAPPEPTGRGDALRRGP